MPARLDLITQQRLQKLERLRASGVGLYPHRYHPSHTSQQAIALFQQQEKEGTAGGGTISIAGRMTAHRLMGKAIFADLWDSAGKIQLYFRQDRLGPEGFVLARELDIGDIVGVSGTLFRTHTGEITLNVTELLLLAKCLQPLPEKWHGLADTEKRYRQRYLDLVSNREVRGIFITRSRVVNAIRCFLNSRGFLEVETPILQASAGGAMARPFVTHHLALGEDLYLRIATELHLKRLVVGGFEKVYEIGRVFRNEGISTKHNPEFTTLESYEAYADYQDVMVMVEEMVPYVASEVLGTTRTTFGDAIIDFSPPWKRQTLREAILEHSGIDFESYSDGESLAQAMMEHGMEAGPLKSRGKLVDYLLSTYVEPKLVQPTFLLDYPVEMSPLAKKKPGSASLVERFEGFAGGMEIANAFSELNDPLEQRARFQQQQREREKGDEEAELPDEDFLLALEHAMPPTGGLGVGIDRLVMLLTNQASIREVILFPQLRTRQGSDA